MESYACQLVNDKSDREGREKLMEVAWKYVRGVES